MELSMRAVAALGRLREDRALTVDPAGPVLSGERLWTYAGEKANRSLVAGLAAVGVEASADSVSGEFGVAQVLSSGDRRCRLWMPGLWRG